MDGRELARLFGNHGLRWPARAHHLHAAEYDRAIEKFKAILIEDPKHFDAQLSLGMAYYRKGDYATAIAEGRKAEKLKPGEQLVHTNLSLFYMKAGDKGLAEEIETSVDQDGSGSGFAKFVEKFPEERVRLFFDRVNANRGAIECETFEARERVF